MSPETTIRQRIESYQEALEARDAVRCTAHFADDAIIHFMARKVVGGPDIHAWHQARFDADFAVLSLEEVAISDDEAVYEVAVTSRKLRDWHLPKVQAAVTLSFDDDQIHEMRYRAKLGSLLAGR